MDKTFDPEKYEMTFCPLCQGDGEFYPSPLRGLRFAKNVEALG